ncbi:MAG: phosphodiester glycosidase family protein [Eubacteriales bacterium]
MRSLKKAFIIFIFLSILIGSPSNALSGNNKALDITDTVLFETENGITNFSKVTDSDIETYLSFSKQDELTITIPSGNTGGYIYLKWFNSPDSYEISYTDKNGNQNTASRSGGMFHETISISEGFTSAKISVNKGSKLSEVTVYSSGNPIDEIQTWSPTVDKADLMVISAHPDDEMLFMGGTIPYYAGECKKDTVVLYMTHQKRIRQTEALNGLWVTGLKTYPVFAGFPDKYSDDLDTVAASWGGKDKVIKYLVEQIRHYKPDVIVTHDEDGEYGHGAHRLVAYCIQKAVIAAKDETKYLDSYNKYGTYEVKKLYLHLYDENKITMDWRIPLSSFNGKTALEMAEAGYSEHLSQQDLSFKVLDTGRTSCAEFGLCYSSVGSDVNKDDFFENIPILVETEESPLAEPEMASSASLSEDTLAEIESLNTNTSFFNNSFLLVISVLAALIAALIIVLINVIKRCTKKALKNFLTASIAALIVIALGVSGYFTYSYLKNGSIFTSEPSASSSVSPSASEPDVSSTSFNYIDNSTSSKKDLNGYFMQDGTELIVNNFETGIWMYRDDSLSITIERKEMSSKKVVYYVADIRTRNGEMPFAAMAQEGSGTARDWPYLLSRNNNAVFGVTSDFLTVQDTQYKGVLIRNGKVYSDGKGEDTLAVMPDGELKIFAKGKITAKELLDMGVENSYSFGPTLINDGVIEDGLTSHRLRSKNPRSSVGMIEPGHYIFIVVDGRDPGHSIGVTLQELAELYSSYGVKVAYAMDGGSSSGMVFMGNSVSQHNMQLNWGQRRNPDLFAFGKSDSVPGVSDPVINKGNGVDVGVKTGANIDTGTNTTDDTSN